MGAGASHDAGDAAAEDKCFYTRTDSLDVWLHQRRFRYQLHAIQRPYEWGKTQVEGLLETVAKAATEADSHGEDAVVKLSEVVLLQNVEGSQRTAHIKSLQSSDWHKGGIEGARTVQIIDGQQRITTLVLIAAVSQHVLRQLAGKMTDEHAEQRQLVNQAVQHLHDRFTFVAHDDSSGHKGLLWRPGQSGGLADGMFNFDADEADISVFDEDLAWLLQAESRDAGANQGPYKANAIHIYNWLTNQLKQAGAGAARRGKAGAAAADDAAVAAAASACAAKQAKWLLDYLEAFRTRVLWTTTLTTSWRLALHTFLNVNLARHRVPLKVMDVVKVTLVSGSNRQRQLTSALQKWDECITQLEACAKMVASKFPYLLLLGSGRKLQGIPSDPVAFSNAVIHDCLCHVRAIQKCLASTRANQGAGSSSASDLANLNGTAADLAQHFAAQRANHQDQMAYLQDTLLPYVQAYCTMLSWQVRSKTDHYYDLRPETRASLNALLSLPASGTANKLAGQDSEPEQADCTWRPAAMAIIRELALKFGLVEAELSGQKQLSDALKQLECVALTVAVSRTAPLTRSTMYERIITAVSQAGSSNDDGQKLKDLIAHNGLCKLAFKDVPVGLRAGSICLIKELFCINAFNFWRGRLAKAVLLILEHDNSLRTRNGAGMVQSWEGPMQLEHLLPQKPDSKDSYWPERFGETGDNTHTTFAHLLGNLSVIGDRDNREMSNQNFPFKMRKISTEWNLTYHTLQPVLEVWREREGACPNGWDMSAVLKRHRWLLQQLADRYSITVQPQQWVTWSEGLNLGSWKMLQGSEQLEALLADWAAAAAAAGTGAVSLTGDSATLDSLPDSIQDKVKRVAQGKALNPKDAEALLRCLHSEPQQRLIPLTSTAPPFKPPVSSLYLFEQQSAVASYSDFSYESGCDGYSWGRRDSVSFQGGTLQKVTHYRQADGEQRRLWRVVPKRGAQGEGAAQPSDPSEGPYRYFLVEYVKYGTCTTDRAPGAAPEQSDEGAAGGDPGTEQQQAPPAPAPAPAGASAGVAEPGTAGPSGTSEPEPEATPTPGSAKRRAEEEAQGEQQHHKRLAAGGVAVTGAAPVAGAAVAGGGSGVGTSAAGAAGEPGAGAAGSSTAEQLHAAGTAPGGVAAASALPTDGSAAAAAAAGTGPVSLTGDGTTLNRLPDSIQDMVKRVAQGKALNPKQASALLRCLHSAEQQVLGPLTSAALPLKPQASSLYLFDQQAATVSYSDYVKADDGYSWEHPDRDRPQLSTGEVLEKVTHYRKAFGEKRCLWRIVPKDSSPSEGAQGEGGTQLTRYFLVEYAKYTPQKRTRQPSAAPEQSDEGAAGGGPGAEQQQAPPAPAPAPAGASAGVAEPGTAGPPGTSEPEPEATPTPGSAKRRAEEEAQGEQQHHKRQAAGGVAVTGAAPMAGAAVAGGGSGVGTPAAGAAGEPGAGAAGSSAAEQLHAAGTAPGGVAAASALPTDGSAAAAAAAGTGAVSLTGDGTTLNRLPDSIQDMVKRVAQGKALNPKQASALLRCLHSAEQQVLGPLTSAALPLKPQASSLYLFDQQAATVSYSDYVKADDGYSWEHPDRDRPQLSTGEVLEKVTHYRKAFGEKRCLWRIVPKDSSPSEGAQGEGGTQLTRYFLVEYAKYTPQKRTRQPSAAPEQSDEGAAGGGPGAEQQQAPPAPAPAPAGASAGVAEPGTAGAPGTSEPEPEATPTPGSAKPAKPWSWGWW